MNLKDELIQVLNNIIIVFLLHVNNDYVQIEIIYYFGGV